MDNSRGRLPRAAGLCLHSYSLEILPPSFGARETDLLGTQVPSFWSSPASTHHVPDSRSEEVYRPLHSSQQPREADTDTPVSRASQLQVRPLSGGTAEPSPFLPPKASPTQSCPTLGDPLDGSPPGPSVHGVLQARTLGWVTITPSRESQREA